MERRYEREPLFQRVTQAAPTWCFGRRKELFDKIVSAERMIKRICENPARGVVFGSGVAMACDYIYQNQYILKLMRNRGQIDWYVAFLLGALDKIYNAFEPHVARLRESPRGSLENIILTKFFLQQRIIPIENAVCVYAETLQDDLFDLCEEAFYEDMDERGWGLNDIVRCYLQNQVR